jgi:2-polyprenyl-6-methoxyphenol hydroxylase-like FAD-dependent oxidoreductase
MPVAMNLDIVIVGGGLAGSSLATVMARKGKKVLVLEREEKFKDRVRGENMLPWGVSIAKRLGLYDSLVGKGGHAVPLFNIYAMGQQTEARPMPQTTPHGEAMLNIYHPDMQEAVLGEAVKAGTEVTRGANVTAISEPNANGRRSVTYTANGASHTVEARVVVGADGRSSRVREWGGFTVNRDPDFLRIAGALMENLSAPDDGIHFSLGPGVASFIAPLGNKRARAYFIYPGPTGDRKLSGKEKIPAFIEGIKSSLVPSAWLEGATVTGPLAEFEGADHWITSPAKRGLALIGDAAGATDPSWGNGLSKSVLDVETLASCLSETDDWDAALESYAKKHDDYFKRLHDILAALAFLFWSHGPEADARRQKVLGKMKENPMDGWPDAAGCGPFGPSDEKACNKLRGIGLD